MTPPPMLTVVSSAMIVVSTMFGSGFVSMTVEISYGLPPDVACTAGGHALTGKARIEAMMAAPARLDGLRRACGMFPPAPRPVPPLICPSVHMPVNHRRRRRRSNRSPRRQPGASAQLKADDEQPETREPERREAARVGGGEVEVGEALRIADRCEGAVRCGEEAVTDAERGQKDAGRPADVVTECGGRDRR